MPPCALIFLPVDPRGKILLPSVEASSRQSVRSVEEEEEVAMKRQRESDRLDQSQALEPSGISRRELLRSAAVLGAGSLLPTAALTAQVSSSSSASKTGRIDVH